MPAPSAPPPPAGSLAALHVAVALFGFAGLFGKWIAWDPAAIVLPSATGGTHAGLVVGARLASSDARIVGVAVAALIAKYPEAGGLYVWAREDFGPWHGFLCFWVYWFSIALTLPPLAALLLEPA